MDINLSKDEIIVVLDALVEGIAFDKNADDIKEKIDKGLIDIGLLTEPVDISKYDFVRLKEKRGLGRFNEKR